MGPMVRIPKLGYPELTSRSSKLIQTSYPLLLLWVQARPVRSLCRRMLPILAQYPASCMVKIQGLSSRSRDSVVSVRLADVLVFLTLPLMKPGHDTQLEGAC